jgi:hypothetical protein
MQQPPGWPPGYGPPTGGGYGPPPQAPPPGYGPQNPYGQPPGYGPQNPYGQPPPYRPPPRAVDPVGQAASWALGLGLGSVILCCLPIGAVGTFFGFKAMRLAKERNVSTPARAFIGMAFGALSLLATIGVGIAVWRDQKAHDARLSEVDAKTKGKLDADELDKATACAVFEKQLLKGLWDGKELVDEVKCVGDYDTKGRRGTLAVRGCLARGQRWFVAGYVPYGATCPDVTLEVKKKGDASEAELEADEDALRKTWKSAADARLADDFVDALAKAGKRPLGDHAEKSCKDLDVSAFTKDDPLKLATVDAMSVAGSDKPDAKWDFLTVSDARNAIAKDAEASKRADAVRAMAKRGGPYVVLYVSEDRATPEVKHDGFSKGFLGGGFRGWMTVVDTRTGTIACDAKLVFENSKTVYTGRFSTDDALERALRSDLQANYKKAAEAAISGASGGKLAIED